MDFRLALRSSNRSVTKTPHQHHIQHRFHRTANNVSIARLSSCSDPKFGMASRVIHFHTRKIMASFHTACSILDDSIEGFPHSHIQEVPSSGKFREVTGHHRGACLYSSHLLSWTPPPLPPLPSPSLSLSLSLSLSPWLVIGMIVYIKVLET